MTMKNHEMVEMIAEYIYEGTCLGDIETIMYQYSVEREWLDEHAKEIIDYLKTYRGAVYGEYDGEYFNIKYAYDMPNLYYWCIHKAQAVGIVMAYSEEDAKAKINHEVDEFYMVEGDTWEDSF